MLIMEVTEKEAIAIYTQRYNDQHFGKRGMIIVAVSTLVAIIAIFVIAGYSSTYFGTELPAFSALALMGPAIYHALKTTHNSTKYARKKIGETL